MTHSITPTEEPNVDDVLDWLADDGQDVYNIGEFWAGYPTEVCLGRISMAADLLSEAVDAGEIPAGCPPVDADTMVAVMAKIAARERWEAGAADRASKAAEEQAAAAARRVRDARREEVYRRLLHPDSGASDSERQQAESHLAGRIQ